MQVYLDNIKKTFWPLLLLIGSINAQTLTVSNGPNDHADSFEDPNGSDVVMIQMQMQASGGDVEVTEITVVPTTQGGNNGIRRDELADTEILLYEDVNNNGVLDAGVDELIAAENYSGSSNAQLSDQQISINNKEILDGTTQNWIVVHNFIGAGEGNYLEIDIDNILVSSGTVSGDPVAGNRRTAIAVDQANVALFIAEGGSNPLDRNVSASASDEVMLQFVLSASTLDTVNISQINFDMIVNGDETNDLTQAELYQDVDGNGILNLAQDIQIGSAVSSYPSSVLSFTGLDENINAGKSENWIVVYTFAGSASNGDTYALDLTANGDVSATSLNATGVTISGAPASSNTATISATGSLTLSLGSNSPGSGSISASESELGMIQINLAANATEDIDIDEIVFKTSGTASEAADIDSAVLIIDNNSNGLYDLLYDTRVNVVSSLTDNGDITFSSLSETISAGSSEDWLLLYYLNGSGSADETFKVYFDNVSQVSATGATSIQTILPLGLPVNGSTMTISSTGTLTIAVAAANPGDENYNGTASNLTMLAFTMSANDVEDIDIENITVRPSTNNIFRSEINGTGNPEIYIYEDVDENGRLNVSVDRFIVSEVYTNEGTGGNESNRHPYNNTVNISGETIAANSAVQWLIVNSITGGSVGDYLEVSVLNTDISATGQTSASSANISGSGLFGGAKTHTTGVPGSLTLSAGSQNPAFRYISAGTQNETMIQFQLSADAVEDIDISEISVTTSGTGNESDDIDSVRLFLDVDNNGSLNLLNDIQLAGTITSLTDNQTLTFSSFNDTINSSGAKNYIIVYNFNSSNNTVAETFQVSAGTGFITATGISSTSDITPTGSTVNGGIATITTTGTLMVNAGASNPGATNVSNADNNVTAIQMNIAAGSNEDVTITSVTFSMTGTFDDATDFESASFVLYDDDNGNGALDGGENQLGTGQDPTGNNGTVTFSGLSQTVLKGTDVNWIVLCNLNGSASNFENFRVSFANSANMSATGDDTGDPIYPSGSPVQGGLFTVGVEGSLTLSTGSNNPATGTENPGATGVEMLQLRLAASGVEDISITSITFTADGTGDDLADLNDAGSGVSLYIDVNNDGQLDGGDTQIGTEGTYSSDDGTITYSISETITASTSENWLVVYDIDAGATNGTTFRTGIYTSAEITATGVTSTNAITPGGFPVVGNFKTITTIGTMSVFAGDFNPGVANISSTTDYEMLQIKLSVSTIEAIDVDDLTITHIGTGDPASDVPANGVKLIRDNNNNGVYESGTDDLLATTSFSGSSATFTLAPVTIAVDNTENWLITYDFSSLAVGETYRARITDLTDLGLTGGTSLQSITASGSVPISGGTMSVDNDFGLPVELTSFVASGGHGFINLEWTTESEINNLGFSLERKLSADVHFESVASYASHQQLNGAGNTSSQTQYAFNDSTVIPGKEYTYRLIQHDYSGAVHVQEILASAVAKEQLPTQFELAQNYPNPFNPETTIKVRLPYTSKITVTIYNILGQEILQLADKQLDAGTYRFNWDGTNQQGIQTSSGLYFYILQVKSVEGANVVKSRKMVKLQ